MIEDFNTCLEALCLYPRRRAHYQTRKDEKADLGDMLRMIGIMEGSLERVSGVIQVSVMEISGYQRTFR